MLRTKFMTLETIICNNIFHKQPTWNLNKRNTNNLILMTWTKQYQLARCFRCRYIDLFRQSFLKYQFNLIIFEKQNECPFYKIFRAANN